MCGIVGIIDKFHKHVDPDQLKRMTDTLSHRGPDEGDIFVDQENRVGLGHRRLSIIDLESGQQPMSNSDATIWIAFNGEIYNYRELRTELQADYQFRTSSDTEVIIALYQKYGEECFERLHGIFAFSIYDKRSNRLFIVRDHFGVKPLYYYSDTKRFIFASEVKAIFEHSAVAKSLDLQALNTFLTFRFNPSPQTLFKNVQKLAPGHYLEFKLANGQIRTSPYWQNKPKTNIHISEGDAIEEYQRLLEAAVQKQMVSDVPIGLLLSGGIDSAVIGYLMRKYSDHTVKTFTVGFSGKGHYNELEDARKTADFIGSDHFELEIGQKDYLDFFFRSFCHTEEPIGEPTIPALYYISKLAGSHLKVVMAGQGADEPLAGYHRYIGEQYLQRYAPILNKLPLRSLAQLLPRNVKIKRAAFASQFKHEIQRFLGIYTIFTPNEKKQLFLDNIQNQVDDVDQFLLRKLHDQTQDITDSVSRLTYVDTRLSLSDSLLLFNDKISMANSLEMRVPFLDVPLVQFLESLPANLKLRGTVGKYIHKKAVSKWLPNEIIYRQKQGFSTPIDKWLQTDLSKTAKALLTSPDSASAQYFDPKFINSIIDRHISRKENHMRRIFSLLSFELWHRSFFQGQQIELAQVA